MRFVIWDKQLNRPSGPPFRLESEAQRLWQSFKARGRYEIRYMRVQCST